MKTLLYFQNPKTIKKSGIGRALNHQVKALGLNDVEVTLDKRDHYDIAHINTMWSKSISLERKLKKNKVPLVVHGHSIFSDMVGSFRCWQIAQIFTKSNIKKCFKYADIIVTPTNYSKKIIENYSCVKCPVVAISNGIDLEEYKEDQNKVNAFKTYFDIKENEKVVIGIGIPFERKGILEFFRIAEEFPTIKFIWFGGLAKILLPSKINRAIRRRPKNVIMPGYIDNDVIKGALQYASCFVFPTKEETEGIVVLEALASKTPVIVSNIGTYTDWLSDGINCFKANSIMEFKSKIEYCLNNDCKEIVDEGYKVAQERSLDKVGKQLKEVYENLLNSKK